MSEELLEQNRKLCIDLCCGLKGFSAAFVDAGWEVVTVDIDSKFAPTICTDVRELILHPDYYPDFWKLKPFVILTSPPCERLSKADDWPLPGIFDGLSITGACLEIVARMRPKYWMLENPRWGYLRWFIGEPTKRVRLNSWGYRTVKPTGLWGNIPMGLINDSPKTNPEPDMFAKGPRNPSARAKMPYGLSQAVLESVEETA